MTGISEEPEFMNKKGTSKRLFLFFLMQCFCIYGSELSANISPVISSEFYCHSIQSECYHYQLNDFKTPPLLSGTQSDHFNGTKSYTIHKENLATPIKDSIITALITELNHEGYLDAYLDSTFSGSGQTIFFLNTGKQFTYYIRDYLVDGKKTPKPSGVEFGRELSFQWFEHATEAILHYHGNKGYPFAQIKKEDIDIDTGKARIQLTLHVYTGEIVFIDSLSVRGTARLSNAFLENILGIKSGMPFSMKALEHAEEKLSELDFVRLTGPPAATFAPGRATILLPLDSEPSNRFDGMAGFSGGGEQNLPVRLTGLLNFYLSNALTMGEFIDFSWQGPGNATQILSVEAGYPFPFRMPLETNILFSLHKQDTSWLHLTFRPGVLFDISRRSKAGIFWQYSTNSLIANPFPSHLNAEPRDLDFQLNLYGLEYRYQTRSYFRQLITQGFMTRVNMAAGVRQIKQNIHAPAAIYENRKMRTTQLNLSGKFEKRWKTGARATFSSGIEMHYQSGKNFPANQLERLGGFRTIRGFDELSLSASSWGFSNLEFRFFTGNESFFNVFINGGWYERRLEGDYYNDFPVGFGIGTNLQTRAGVFSIIAALGMARSISAEPRNAKIHIGYIAGF